MSDLSPYVRVVAVVRQDNLDDPLLLARVDTITTDQDHATARVVTLAEEAEAAGHRLPNLAVTQTVGVVPLPADVLALIDDLTDPAPCSYDHHDTCQAHARSGDGPGCATARAQELLATARREGIMPAALP